MRQRKSNAIYYVIGAVLLAAVVFVVVHEVPMTQEHVEVEVPFSGK